MLIEEKGVGTVSPIASQNGRKEVKKAISASECNKYLSKGWGLLSTVGGSPYYDELRSVMMHPVAFIMYRTVNK